MDVKFSSFDDADKFASHEVDATMGEVERRERKRNAFVDRFVDIMTASIPRDWPGQK